MIVLVSTWKLADGCPHELKEALDDLISEVKRHEPGTLMYTVSLRTFPPPIGPPPDYTVFHSHSLPDLPDKPTEIVFFEMYRDSEAFGKHLKGPFMSFVAKYREYFQTPYQGQVRPETIYLDLNGGFTRMHIMPPQARLEVL